MRAHTARVWWEYSTRARNELQKCDKSTVQMWWATTENQPINTQKQNWSLVLKLNDRLWRRDHLILNGNISPGALFFFPFLNPQWPPVGDVSDGQHFPSSGSRQAQTGGCPSHLCADTTHYNRCAHTPNSPRPPPTMRKPHTDNSWRVERHIFQVKVVYYNTTQHEDCGS